MNILRIADGADVEEEDSADMDEEGSTEVDEDGPSPELASGARTNKVRTYAGFSLKSGRAVLHRSITVRFTLMWSL